MYGIIARKPIRSTPSRKMGFATIRKSPPEKCPQCGLLANELHQPHPHKEYYVCESCFPS